MARDSYLHQIARPREAGLPRLEPPRRPRWGEIELPDEVAAQGSNHQLTRSPALAERESAASVPLPPAPAGREPLPSAPLPRQRREGAVAAVPARHGPLVETPSVLPVSPPRQAGPPVSVSPTMPLPTPRTPVSAETAMKDSPEELGAKERTSAAPTDAPIGPTSGARRSEERKMPEQRVVATRTVLTESAPPRESRREPEGNRRQVGRTILEPPRQPSPSVPPPKQNGRGTLRIGAIEVRILPPDAPEPVARQPAQAPLPADMLSRAQEWRFGLGQG
jgi:hypothetical protein